MFDFHEKRKIKSWLFSKTAIFLLFLASIFLATSVYERYQKERETARKHAERAAELEQRKYQAALLESEVAYIQSERGIEEEIRDRFDVVKQGEQAVVVIDNMQPTTAEPSSMPLGSMEEEEDRSSGGFFPWLLFWRKAE